MSHLRKISDEIKEYENPSRDQYENFISNSILRSKLRKTAILLNGLIEEEWDKEDLNALSTCFNSIVKNSFYPGQKNQIPETIRFGRILQICYDSLVSGEEQQGTEGGKEEFIFKSVINLALELTDDEAYPLFKKYNETRKMLHNQTEEQFEAVSKFFSRLSKLRIISAWSYLKNLFARNLNYEIHSDPQQLFNLISDSSLIEYPVAFVDTHNGTGIIEHCLLWLCINDQPHYSVLRDPIPLNRGIYQYKTISESIKKSSERALCLYNEKNKKNKYISHILFRIGDYEEEYYDGASIECANFWATLTVLAKRKPVPNIFFTGQVNDIYNRIDGVIIKAKRGAGKYQIFIVPQENYDELKGQTDISLDIRPYKKSEHLYEIWDDLTKDRLPEYPPVKFDQLRQFKFVNSNGFYFDHSVNKPWRILERLEKLFSLSSKLGREELRTLKEGAYRRWFSNSELRFEKTDNTDAIIKALCLKSEETKLVSALLDIGDALDLDHSALAEKKNPSPPPDNNVYSWLAYFTPEIRVEGNYVIFVLRTPSEEKEWEKAVRCGALNLYRLWNNCCRKILKSYDIIMDVDYEITTDKTLAADPEVLDKLKAFRNTLDFHERDLGESDSFPIIEDILPLPGTAISADEALTFALRSSNSYALYLKSAKTDTACKHKWEISKGKPREINCLPDGKFVEKPKKGGKTILRMSQGIFRSGTRFYWRLDNSDLKEIVSEGVFQTLSSVQEEERRIAAAASKRERRLAQMKFGLWNDFLTEIWSDLLKGKAGYEDRFLAYQVMFNAMKLSEPASIQEQFYREVVSWLYDLLENDEDSGLKNKLIRFFRSAHNFFRKQLAMS
jgi:hypothetical protein